MQVRYNYLVIEGNIGAGKTTLARKIADQFNARLVLEQFADNPFLPKFYSDPDKYSFPLELSFLASRYRQLVEELGHPDLFKEFFGNNDFPGCHDRLQVISLFQDQVGQLFKISQDPFYGFVFLKGHIFCFSFSQVQVN